MKQVFVIMPIGQGNALAWSSCCWLSKQDAEDHLQEIYQEEWKERWYVAPLNIMGRPKGASSENKG